MIRILLLVLAFVQVNLSFGLASLKITFSGTQQYKVSIDGVKYHAYNQYFEINQLNSGNHVLKFYLVNGYAETFLHQTHLFTQDRTETIGIFDQNNFLVKSVNTVHNNNFGQNGYWTNEELNNSDFQKVLEEVKDEAFDSKKKDLMLKIIGSSKISTAQAVQLLNTYSFDSDRYDGAVALVNVVHDQQNLWQVGEVFTFDSNKKKYLEYIDHVPGSQQTTTNNWNYGNSMNSVMHQNDFSKLYDAVDDEAFDANKTKVIMQSVKHTSISTSQAIQLLNTFSFDGDRLSCAKKLIPYISDRQNYWQAGDAFKFDSNKKEFLDAL